MLLVVLAVVELVALVVVALVADAVWLVLLVGDASSSPVHADRLSARMPAANAAIVRVRVFMV
ncbi:hypothetical protein [Corynebacterium variabile]|uniref:hypothetical protein n=1 Tax=Corynebacterium variabile TaxID=1727 RepID=UPI002FE24B6A